MDVEIEGDSAEAVAFALLRMVMEAEGRDDGEAKEKAPTKAWILDTYVECLAAVNGARLSLDEDDDEDEDGANGDEEDDEDGDDDDAEEPAEDPVPEPVRGKRARG